MPSFHFWSLWAGTWFFSLSCVFSFPPRLWFSSWEAAKLVTALRSRLPEGTEFWVEGWEQSEVFKSTALRFLSPWSRSPWKLWLHQGHFTRYREMSDGICMTQETARWFSATSPQCGRLFLVWLVSLLSDSHRCWFVDPPAGSHHCLCPCCSFNLGAIGREEHTSRKGFSERIDF